MGTNTRNNGGRRGQHFLLSAEARRLSIKKIARLTEAQAHKTFCRIRWAFTQGEPVCPKCACLAVNVHKSRPIFSCKACSAQFSVTSGTIFHSRKLSFTDILLAIAFYINGAKGHSACQLSRDLDVQYKTAFVLLHKLRESLDDEISRRTTSGEVHVDGVYFGGYIKPANYKDNRVDRRLAKNQNGKRRVVVVIKEKNGRTMPFVVRQESDATPELIRRITPKSWVHLDEANSWNAFKNEAKFKGIDVETVNHEKAYSDGGIDTNAAESFNSRIRRAEIGIHHRITTHLKAYANEMAWREDARLLDNGTQFLIMAQSALLHGKSQGWRGCWQGRKTWSRRTAYYRRAYGVVAASHEA